MIRDDRLWGIDLGGTKIEGVVVSATDPGRVVARTRIPTESALGYAHIVSRVRLVVEQLEAAARDMRPAVIGVGTPGAVEPAAGALKNSNTTCLNGKPLARDLADALGTETRLANDANCFALAEATLGAARGRDVVIGLILGTGVGSGIVVHGRVLDGLHGIAGEWGHNPMCGETAPCYSGRAGCVETVISGPALERFYASCSGDRGPGRSRRRRGSDARKTGRQVRRSDSGGDQHPRPRRDRDWRRRGQHRAAVRPSNSRRDPAAPLQLRAPHRDSAPRVGRQRRRIWRGTARSGR